MHWFVQLIYNRIRHKMQLSTLSISIFANKYFDALLFFICFSYFLYTKLVYRKRSYIFVYNLLLLFSEWKTINLTLVTFQKPYNQKWRVVFCFFFIYYRIVELCEWICSILFCLSYLVEIRHNWHDLIFMFIVVCNSFWCRAKITWYNIIWSAIIKKVYNIHGSPELVRLTHKHLSLHANCQFICQHFKSMTLKSTPFLSWNKR